MLEDHESEEESLESEQDSRPAGRNKRGRKSGIGEGLESCVGNTPLFRIKSLSDATGCEILAKAELLNGGGGSPKDRVALNMIKTVHTFPTAAINILHTSLICETMSDANGFSGRAARSPKAP